MYKITPPYFRLFNFLGLALISIVMFSCSPKEEEMIQNPSDEILEQMSELSDPEILPRYQASSPAPECIANWNNPPGCPQCQVHTANGLHVYFYCTLLECRAFFQIDQPMTVSFSHPVDGIFYQTTPQTTTQDDPNHYYRFLFDEPYNDIINISATVPGQFGQSVAYYYNCL